MEAARVRLAIGVNGDIWEFERKGRANGSSLTSWQAGVEASEPDGESQLASLFGDFNPASLSNAVGTWGVLRQDAVRAALEGGAAMHDRLAAVVGLERVSLFAESAGRVAKELSQQRKRLEGMCSEARSKSVQAAEALDEARNVAGRPRQPRRFCGLSSRESEHLYLDGLTVHVDADLAVEGLLRLSTHVSSLIGAVSRVLEAHREVVSLIRHEVNPSQSLRHHWNCSARRTRSRFALSA